MKKGLILIMAIIMCATASSCTGSASNNKKAPSVNVYEKLSSDINVVDCGAVKDGSADVSAALQAAIKEAQEKVGRVFFPKGVYLISKQITFPSGITVVFEEGATIKSDLSYLTINSTLVAGNYQIFDGDCVFKVNSIITGNPCWFGAKADGVTDDTQAFVKAYKSFNELELPTTENPFVIETLDVISDMSLKGKSPESKGKIKASSKTTKLFTFAKSNVKISNISFEMADAPDNSTVFYFDTAKTYLERVYIRNCDFNNAYHVFTDAKDKNVMMHMHFEDLNFNCSRNSSVLIEDFEGFIFFKRIKIDNSQSFTAHSLSDGFPIIKIEDVRGTIFEDMDITGGNSGFDTEVAFSHPATMGTTASVWWERVKVRNTSGQGISVGQTLICSFVDVEIDNCGGGIYASNALELNFERVKVTNSKASKPGKEAHGIYLKSCEFSQLNNVVSIGNAGAGVFSVGSKYTTLSHCELNENETYGYNESSGKQNMLLDSVCIGNKMQQININGQNGRVGNIVVKKGEDGISFSGSGTK